MLSEMPESATEKQSTDVASFLRILHTPGSVFEIRSPKCPDRKGGSYTSTALGYFIEPNAAAKAIESLERLEPPAVYVSVNPVNPSLIGRAANRIVPKATATMADNDATSRRWLFIDIDSKRSSGVSATDQELAAADALSDALLEAMRSKGWPEPLQGMSGNGRYLVWRIDLPNDDASRDLIQSVLVALGKRFNIAATEDTAGAEVDKTTFNAGRIMKVLGTVARKGDPVIGVAGIDDRPHRRSWFITPDAPLEIVPVDMLRDLVPVEGNLSDVKADLGSPKSSFDIDRWLQDHGVPVANPVPYSGGRKWLFAELPKCCESSGHGFDGSSCIIQRSDGSLGASCQHNHCTWGWRDLRQAYEPDAYTKTKTTEVGLSNDRPTSSGEFGAGGTRETLGDVPPEDVADLFLASQRNDGHSTLRFWAGSYWKWLNGRYVELTTSDIRSNLVRELQRSYKEIKTQDVGHVLLNVSAGCSVMSCIGMPRWLDGGDEIARTWRPEDTFTTKSHIVHLPSLVSGQTPYSVPSTPAYFNAIAADYDFAADAAKPVRWFQFLNELFGDDTESKELLRQWFGYCLTPDTRQHKIMLMVGPPRSGKGTIGRIMRSLVGDDNCCAPTLSSLATNFGISPLLGKTLAIIGDARLSGRVDVSATTERLLSISGEDSQTIDRKHREPVTTQLKTRFMVISNELPRLNDASGALAGRLLILKFTRSFLNSEDKALQSVLETEKQGILAWAIGGWAALRDRGRFVQPKASRDLVEQMADIASPITSFVADCCDIEPNACVALDRLYESFRTWSESNGIERPVSKPVFSRDLSAAYPSLSRYRPNSGDGATSRKTNVLGIKIAALGGGV